MEATVLPGNMVSLVMMGLVNSLRVSNASRAMPQFLMSKCNERNFPFSESGVI